MTTPTALLRILFCILLAVWLPQQAYGEIVELTDATFEHETQASTGMTTGSWLVLFKAAKCGHCKAFLPEFEKLADDEELKEQGIVFATVDVPSNRKLALRFDIRGFPILLYFHRGQLYRYKGKRSYEPIRDWLALEIGPTGSDVAAPQPIPPPMNALQEFKMTLNIAFKELSDLAVNHPKHGFAGKGVVALIVVFFGLLSALILMCILPSSSSSKTKQQ